MSKRNRWLGGVSFSGIGIMLLLISPWLLADLKAAGLSEALSSLFSEEQMSTVSTRFGKGARERVDDWRLLLEEMKKSEGDSLGRFDRANQFFNRVPWVTDIEHWGKQDYWATPVEMLASNGGDCEDYSIGKFFTLAVVGVDPSKLRLTYVKALELNQAHMVLAYYETPQSDPLIFDNINRTILPASQRSDLLPVYSFNAQGLWLARSSVEPLRARSPGLPQWVEMLSRLAGVDQSGQ